MSLPVRGRRIGFVVATLVTAILSSSPLAVAQSGATGQPGATELTEQQKQQLKERDQYWEQAHQLHRDEKLSEAIAAAEKVLAIERELFGNVHAEVVSSLELLAKLHEQLEAFGSARKARQEVLAIKMELFGGKHWRVADAHWAVRHVEILRALNPHQRIELREAKRLHGQLVQLNGQANLRKAVSFAQRSLQIRKKLLPEKHPDLGSSLHDLGDILSLQDEYSNARKYYEEALEMYRRLYSKDDYPNGHPDVASILNDLGDLFWDQGEYSEAHNYFKQALEMRRRLYPEKRYPQGHRHLATSLQNVGAVFAAQGEPSEARKYCEEALEMRRRLYATDQYPNGHRDLASSLNDLGDLLFDQGEYNEARKYYEQALEMRRRLYPEKQYPEGHPELARSLINLSGLLVLEDEYDLARKYRDQALVMYRRRYPQDKYPQGHLQLAIILNDVGIQLMSQDRLLMSQEEYDEARKCYEEALGIYRGCYPEDEYPQGHPHLTATLNNLGDLLRSQGKYGEARKYLEQALEMFRRHYPEDQYPEGHLVVANSLHNLATLLWDQGEDREAYEHLAQGLEMYQNLAERFFATASEAEALNFATSQPPMQSLLLSVCRQFDAPTDELYRFVWQGRRGIQHVMAGRQQMIGAMATPTIRAQYQSYLNKRRALAALTRFSTDPDLKQLAELTQAKEHLERELAAAVPPFRRSLEARLSSHVQLIEKLPPGTVFVDVLAYTLFEHAPNPRAKKITDSYVAFVLRPGKPVVRVELGPVAPIDDAIEQWRRSLIGAARPHSAGKRRLPQESPGRRLRKLVWEPLEQVLPARAQVVFVCPDGKLTYLPWTALPGRTPDRFLLEEYAVAVVPSGPFLWERLTSERTIGDTHAGVFLAVGDVDYDAKPARSREPVRLALRGDVYWGDEQWDPLPATDRELTALLSIALDRTVVEVSGTKASTARILAELPQVRWAHFATHGFFANANIRYIFELDFPQIWPMASGERIGPTSRNPLVLSGLVLAGANLPRPTNEEGVAEGDGGILTAEAIAGLPLHNLELATLSACETGLGDVAGSEGVFGLQRAFHIAGAHTVVASLWKVDDQATQELMTHFYRNMWEKGMGKLQALRQAQLSILNQPGESSQSGDRGPGAVVPQPADATLGHARPELWAAWVLSGDPGDLSFAIQPPESVTSTAAAAVKPVNTDPAATIPTLVYIVAASVSLVLLVGMAWYVRRRSVESKS